MQRSRNVFYSIRWLSHNCLLNNDTHYGLNAYGATSVIDIVLPLTKKILSYNNRGGGNWGGGGKFNKKILCKEQQQNVKY